MRRPPLAGLAVACGLAVAESGLVLSNLLKGFGRGDLIQLMLPVMLVYAAVGMAVDWLGRRHSLATRALLAAMAAMAVGIASGQLLFSLGVVVLFAWIWARIALSPKLWPLAALVALAALWRALPGWGDAPPPTRPADVIPQGPNLALIVLDTQRLDRCSTYGYPKQTTPNLTALAARGARFDRAWSASHWSLAAHGSIFTGLPPSVHGADGAVRHIDAAQTLFPELLAAAGYDTAGFSANPFAGTGTGMAQGFAYFEDHWRRFTLGEVMLGLRAYNAWFAPDRDKGAQKIVSSVARWLDARDPARPFFLFVNLMEPHAPFQEAPLPWRLAFTDERRHALERAGERVHMAQIFDVPVDDDAMRVANEALDGCTLGTDAQLGRILALLDDDTVVFVISDHGEGLGEHGHHGHNVGLWEELLRVPMVAAGPGIPAGIVVEAPVSLMDLHPTLLALAGLSPPPTAGINLLPALHGTESLAGRVVFAEQGYAVYTTSGWQTRYPLRDLEPERIPRTALTDGRFKRVIVSDGRDLGYDLRADPGELRPFDGALTGLQPP